MKHTKSAIGRQWCWVLLLLPCGLLAGCSGGHSGDSPRVMQATAVGYVQAQLDNTVTSFFLDEQDGGLVLVESVPAGTYPAYLAITPDSHFLYVSNTGDGTISAFQLDGSGGMRSAGPTAPLKSPNGQPTTIVVAPSGQFLFVGTTTNAIEAFHIDSQSGDLQPLPSSPFPVASIVTQLALTHSGQFLYATGGNSDAIYMFAVDSAGGLTPLPSSPVHTGLNPNRLRLHPSGKYLFAAAYQVQYYEVNTLLIYSIQDSGDLQETPTSRVATGRYVPDFTVAPNGRFMYIVALFDNNILGFSFDPATAALAPMPGSPFEDGQTPSAVAVSPQGNILAVGRINPGHIASFGIDPQTGALSPISGNLPDSGIVTGHNPNSIVLVPK